MHIHNIDCYATNEGGKLAYTPCRKDGLDRNLRNVKMVDYEACVRVHGHPVMGLTLVCEYPDVVNTGDEATGWIRAKR